MAILTQESENRLKIFLGTDKFPCTGEKFPGVYKIVCLPTNKVYAAEYAARDLKLHQGNIVNCCKGKRKTTGGYKWMYKSDYYGNIRTGNS